MSVFKISKPWCSHSWLNLHTVLKKYVFTTSISTAVGGPILEDIILLQEILLGFDLADI
jgi:hypothetical protein